MEMDEDGGAIAEKTRTGEIENEIEMRKSRFKNASRRKKETESGEKTDCESEGLRIFP